MMKAFFILFLIGLFTTVCFSQNKENIESIRNIFDEKGDYYFDKKDFKKSVVYYNMAYKKDAKNYYSVLRKAEAYASLGLYDQAAECYRIVFETNLQISNEYRLKFALLLLKNKDIKGFEEWMGKYNAIVHSEIYDYLTATDIRAKMYYDSSLVIVENESVLNTAESEICPVVYSDKVLFASTRKNLAGSTGTEYNLFTANYLNNGQLGKLNFYNTSLNSAQNELSVFCSDNSKKLYLTRSASTNSNLKTYSANIPVKMNDVLTPTQFTIEGFSNIGHVSLNTAGNKMYFVSEAPGGMGGLDIYSSDLVGGKWSKPKNMGPGVNSNKDEMYPFVLNDSVLYFTSAGHNSLGGLDLFFYNMNQKNSSAKNLGSINSKYDEYGLSFSPEGLTGYFCSNRPDGFGKEDIYRLHLLNIKVRYPAYRFKKKQEDDKLNLYLSNGTEYTIAPENAGYSFSFQPQEDYKIIIQHENPLISNVVYNNKLNADQRKKEFLDPTPFQKTEIKLQPGIKYLFSAGTETLTNEYKTAIGELSGEYENSGGMIDLNVLAKELPLKEGEIYTVQFIKDNSRVSENTGKSESLLSFNTQTIPLNGESIFIVLPLKKEAAFTVKTDIVFFKKAFNPKKAGMVKLDTAAVYKEETVTMPEGFPILMNTESFSEAGSKISATELYIIPGITYILTFGKTDQETGETGVIIPLTKGVKYNLGSEAQSESEYNKSISQFSNVQTGNNNPAEELIDISVLSKELDIFSQRDIVFNLMPAKQFASQSSGGRSVLTTLAVDGRKYFVTSMQKLQVNLKLDENSKVNIQTDLSFVKENFDPSTIALKVDTTSFNSNLNELKKNVITDPVFDVIVVNFNLNDYSIRSDAKNIIANKVIEVLRSDSRLYVTIKGYTDPLGDAAHNEKLSKNRAVEVKDFLTANGIGENRIRTFSYGATQALKEGENWKDLSESELEKHRKVEIVIYLPK